MGGFFSPTPPQVIDPTAPALHPFRDAFIDAVAHLFQNPQDITPLEEGTILGAFERATPILELLGGQALGSFLPPGPAQPPGPPFPGPADHPQPMPFPGPGEPGDARILPFPGPGGEEMARALPFPGRGILPFPGPGGPRLGRILPEPGDRQPVLPGPGEPGRMPGPNPFIQNLIQGIEAQGDIARRQLGAAAQRAGALTGTDFMRQAGDLEAGLARERGNVLANVWEAERGRQMAAVPMLGQMASQLLGFAAHPREVRTASRQFPFGVGQALLGAGQGPVTPGQPSPFASLLGALAPWARLLVRF
jgi:hypothetical protein